jgi:hypothetical protein
VNLVKERLSWKKEFQEGVIPLFSPYEEYKQNRLSEMWRSSRYSEKWFEYVKWLEDKFNDSQS